MCYNIAKDTSRNVMEQHPFKDVKKKGHTPSITTVTITVYLKENGNKKKVV